MQFVPCSSGMYANDCSYATAAIMVIFLHVGFALHIRSAQNHVGPRGLHILIETVLTTNNLTSPIACQNWRWDISIAQKLQMRP